MCPYHITAIPGCAFCQNTFSPPSPPVIIHSYAAPLPMFNRLSEEDVNRIARATAVLVVQALQAGLVPIASDASAISIEPAEDHPTDIELFGEKEEEASEPEKSGSNGIT